MNPEAFLQVETTTRQQPLVCAYVITYNGKRYLERCFETLQSHTDYGNWHLILVDNGSSDGSGDFVRENFPAAEILRIFPNSGFAHGANAAVEDARQRHAKYIVLLNDDIAILHPQWLRDAISSAELDPSIGLIGYVESTSEDGPHPASESKLIDVQYLNSAVFAMPVDLFDRIGMFDEVYYLVGDENDLGERAQAAGYRTAKLGIPIVHFGGRPGQAVSRRTSYFQMRNGIRSCLKNRSPMCALVRALRFLDVACNPWPITFDKKIEAHFRIRNSGSAIANLLLWLRAVSWNIVRLPQTYRIRAGERRLIRAARAAREDAGICTQPRVEQAQAGQLTF